MYRKYINKIYANKQRTLIKFSIIVICSKNVQKMCKPNIHNKGKQRTLIKFSSIGICSLYRKYMKYIHK